MNHAIPPGKSVSAVYSPRWPAHMIPPPDVIPWIGLRLGWVAVHPDWDGPIPVAFKLVGGGDGFGIIEGCPIGLPAVVVAEGALRDIRVNGAGGPTP